MIRKAPSKLALLVAAGAVSACTTADGPYPQGPWGASVAQRSYPEYSAPWGRRQAAPAYGVAVQPAYVEALSGPTRRIHEVHLEPELPPGPLPNGPTLELDRGPEPLSMPLPEQPVPVQREASADIQASAPGVFTPPQRASSYAGSWKASVGSASCRIQLSSVPSLDLYKASAQGCSSNALRTVNGWSLRDGQVILFSRGQVITRLSGAEAALSGTLNGSEAELTMTR
ncbi:AprI/Inh family metalloprotease inhibitor [Microvirga splendida]|uniref:AprI/Inh family metalloprotease inhibitor n=1 Tax=Microvirga splendida TaxID=2795727 RepID=A0ABS0XV52_9HYPH|nr:AprI/Inh family metalloprotease inhibitor [Microvirga splendida]MBJ6123927.1 AprI/Inh family metalloprotease inhibitor [Microvirga splendida]